LRHSFLEYGHAAKSNIGLRVACFLQRCKCGRIESQRCIHRRRAWCFDIRRWARIRIFKFDDEDKSLQVHGGYKIFKHLAVEARYADFGTFSLQSTGFDVTAISIHAVGIIPFGESGWELFGQLGLGTVTFDRTGSGDEDQSVAAGGIGVRYSPTQNFSLSIQTDVYVWEDDSLGPVFDMGVGGTQLALQYIF
jgi:hypothetical protein